METSIEKIVEFQSFFKVCLNEWFIYLLKENNISSDVGTFFLILTEEFNLEVFDWLNWFPDAESTTFFYLFNSLIETHFVLIIHMYGFLMDRKPTIHIVDMSHMECIDLSIFFHVTWSISTKASHKYQAYQVPALFMEDFYSIYVAHAEAPNGNFENNCCFSLNILANLYVLRKYIAGVTNL